jgi:hypothetical protein
MKRIVSKIKNFEIIISIVNSILLLIVILIQLDIIEISKGNNINKVTYWFNLYYIVLSFFYITIIRFKENTFITFSNNFLVFPLSRFQLFLLEYKKLAGNILIVLLSCLSFFLIITFELSDAGFFRIFRLAIIFAFQYHIFHWLFLYFKNLFRQNTTHLLSVFIFVQILNTLSSILHQAKYMLNPLFGWLMIPEIFQFSSIMFFSFVTLATAIFFILYKFTSKTVKWHP